MTYPGGGQQDPWQTPQGGQPRGYPVQPNQQTPQGYPVQPNQPPAQGYPPQPGAGQPQSYPPSGSPATQSPLIRLTVQGSVLTSNMLTPKVQIDGYPVSVSYGLNTIPVPPGTHTVSAHATWIVQYGQASYDVTLAPGQTVDVYYAAPFVQFMKGSMGPTKQPRKGLWVLIAVIVLIIVFGVIPIMLGG
ncbi:hypothetical protein [Flexivirga meconopsidis]|uniref:hypothetical protein n=1 Tax=Flexivirga meconopsidis TaxID=2977121 RepID=UPI00223F8AE1|nr:hypothetical protein [Flexivirga meconopsidis]